MQSPSRLTVPRMTFVLKFNVVTSMKWLCKNWEQVMTWIVVTGWKNAKSIKINGSSTDIRVEVKCCCCCCCVNILNANTELHAPKLPYSTPVCHTCLLEERGTDVLNTDTKPTGILNLMKQSRKQYKDFLISYFRRVLNVAWFLLGNSDAGELPRRMHTTIWSLSSAQTIVNAVCDLHVCL